MTTPDDQDPLSEADRRARDDRRGPLDPAAAAEGRRTVDKEYSVRAAIRRELDDDAREDVADELAHPTRQEESVIALNDIFLSFEQPILEDIGFSVMPGETVCVVGESGTGKSTILKLILRLLVPDSGTVTIDGQDITAVSYTDALRIRQKLGMVFQSAALFDSMTVFDNIAYPLREHVKMPSDQIESRVRETLEFVDLEPDRVMDQLPSQLSGGMRKRVGIARGMSANPKIMLYDEPTSGLDPLTTGTITRLISKLQRELGVSSVVVSHDIRSVFRMATRVVLLYQRKVHFTGTPEEMSASEDRYIRDFLGGF